MVCRRQRDKQFPVSCYFVPCTAAKMYTSCFWACLSLLCVSVWAVCVCVCVCLGALLRWYRTIDAWLFGCVGVSWCTQYIDTYTNQRRYACVDLASASVTLIGIPAGHRTSVGRYVTYVANCTTYAVLLRGHLRKKQYLHSNLSLLWARWILFCIDRT